MAKPSGGQAAELQVPVMQGDVVRSSWREEGKLGWVCCITPEKDEGHVYWQPYEGTPAVDAREPLRSLRCTDRTLIPGDIVRRCDITAGESRDRGGRDKDGLGMVVDTEVALDLRMPTAEGEAGFHLGMPASSVEHLLPARLANWVVHREQGWLGRVLSWEEDLIIRFTPGTSTAVPQVGTLRCRIPAANMKMGTTLADSFYRDYFPGLAVNVNAQDLKRGILDVEWLEGSLIRVFVAFGLPLAEEFLSPPPRLEAIIEEVKSGLLRVEWLAQVPLAEGFPSDRPPSSEVSVDSVSIMLGEAESASRWALGDRLIVEGALCEVCGVETCVDVRWQDDALSVRVPARELQLGNPDAYSFFPSELVCCRIDASSGRGAVPGREGSKGSQEDRRRDERVRLGYVVRADPASRMVIVRWMDEASPSKAEEEWSAFDLQQDPEAGFRLGDAVIMARDWEERFSSGSERSEPAVQNSGHQGPKVGQVVALESGVVRVKWLGGQVMQHDPRELYRFGDEDDGSVEGSQDAEVSSEKEAHGNHLEGAGGPDGSSGPPDLPEPTEPAAETEETPQEAAEPAEAEEPTELTMEDITWETLPPDHHFGTSSSSSGGAFMRRVQREWSVLCRGLPRCIWVHVYPERMDLLRACLVGPEGTPYVDALFFFDLCLPPTYPQVPPQVRFWSFGENLNPNLYESGKVCLSLLGTWSGKETETWSAERSNLLQVLVSILGLVLNAEPYYNEPGFERERDTPQGDLLAKRYNESVALSCFHLMLRVLRTPPADFEEAARKHFTARREAILERARGLQEGEESKCSEGFRKSLAALFPRLEEALPKEL